MKALQGVDLEVVAGEVHCLLGPNGAGKSTLIKCVSGASSRPSGEILFDGEPLPVGDPAGSLERGVATIYQELDLVEDLTVAQSIFLGARAAPRAAARPRPDEPRDRRAARRGSATTASRRARMSERCGRRPSRSSRSPGRSPATCAC